MKPRKELRDLLAQKNLKNTSQRALVWKILIESDDHPTVEAIRDHLISKGHRIGLATVYRTLKILLAAGLIRQSKMRGSTCYEAVVKQPNHLHFVCNGCRRNVEYPSRRIQKLIGQITAEQSFEERYSRYVISGLCKSCRREEAKSAVISEKDRAEKTIVRDAMELTLNMERLGVTFYINASRKTRNDNGRRMFQRLAAEESDHLKRLQKEYQDLIQDNEWLKREPARLPVNRKVAQELIPQKDLLRLEVRDDTTELEALNIAMQLERRSHRFFKNFAEQLSDSSSRKVFMEIAKEEQVHFKTLLKEYKAVSEGR
jgi:Fur family transcriptional regulator, ferric uptake regulator